MSESPLSAALLWSAEYWSLTFVSSSLPSQLFLGSLASLRIDSPVKLNLLSPRRSAAKLSSNNGPPESRTASSEDLLSALTLDKFSATVLHQNSRRQSLSSNLFKSAEIRHPAIRDAPVFGVSTALSNPLKQICRNEDIRSDEPSGMDWEPTPRPTIHERTSCKDSIVLNPQVFLPPPGRRGETGIEQMFERSVNLHRDNDPSISKPWAWISKFLFRPSSSH